ncbi:hypothetical protein IAU60_006784 [Kwoniella sp. DSM 27419]
MSRYTPPHDHHRRPLDMAVYFITFGLAVATVAATSNALVQRNRDIGDATRAAAAAGGEWGSLEHADPSVKVIISTNSLTQPGYALCATAGGTVVNALTLFFFSFKVPAHFRKLIWLLPLAAVFNFVFLVATCIAVFHAAKNGELSLYGTLNGIVLPDSLLEANAAKLGLSNSYWGKGYVKFMAIVSVPTTLFALFVSGSGRNPADRQTAILAFFFWRRERSQSISQVGRVVTHDSAPDLAEGEKGQSQHIERV